MLGLLAVGSLLLAGAMALYPGGTFCDATTEGHDFFGNFVCDLTWPVSLSGEPNARGAALGQLAMGTLSLAVTLLFLSAPALFAHRPRLARLAQAAGALAGLGLLAVTLMPSSSFGRLHAVVVFLAAAPAVVAALAVVVGLFAGEPRPRVAAGVGSVTLVVALADLLLFARHVALRDGCTPWVPGLQKVALLLLLVWVAVVGVRVRAA